MYGVPLVEGKVGGGGRVPSVCRACDYGTGSGCLVEDETDRLLRRSAAEASVADAYRVSLNVTKMNVSATEQTKVHNHPFSINLRPGVTDGSEVGAFGCVTK